MKTQSDPRHQKRKEAILHLFANIFCPDQERGELASIVLENKEKVDVQIVTSAPEWPLERINKIDLAILRLAIFELIVQKTEPPKVIIDEAIELAKEFGSESSSSFINGVLGDVWKRNE